MAPARRRARTLVGAVAERRPSMAPRSRSVPVAETLKRVDGGLVGATVDRSGLAAAQTPQGVRLDPARGPGALSVLLVAVMLFFPDGIVVTLARELPKRGWRALVGLRKGKAG